MIKEVEPVADFFFELFGVFFGAFGLVKNKEGFALALDAKGAPVRKKIGFAGGYLEDVFGVGYAAVFFVGRPADSVEVYKSQQFCVGVGVDAEFG